MGEEKSLVDIAQERLNNEAQEWAINKIKELLLRRTDLMRQVADINIEITNVKPEDGLRLRRPGELR